MGFGLPARFIVGYIYLNELLPEKWRSIIASVGLFFVSETVTFGAIYFW